MADVLSIALSFPPEKTPVSPQDYDRKIHAYIKDLWRIGSAQWTKAVDKRSLLDLIDPAVNSLAYMACLDEHCKMTGSRDAMRTEDLFNYVVVFFASFDPVQVRYAGSRWRGIFEWAWDCLQKSDIMDVTVLSTAILRLDPSAGTFTTNHLIFLRLCLEKGVPSAALPIIDRNIYAFPHAAIKGVQEELPSEQHELSNAYITAKSEFSRKVTPEYVLEYYLFGAHVYIATRNYDRARLFLEIVLLTPTQQHTASAFQVEVYKKWLLVGLLSTGRQFLYPKTADQVVMKSVKSLSKAYEALADNFEKRDWRKFQAELSVGTQAWADDSNLRLVNETATALLRYRIVDLQKTYAALPVSRVASYLSISADEALRLLTHIIRSGDLSAGITPAADSNPANAVLRFHFTSANTTSTAQEAQLQAQTQRIEELVASVRDADRRLQLTKEWVEVQKRSKRAGPDAELADQMDLTWDAPAGGEGIVYEDGDEDIMA